MWTKALTAVVVAAVIGVSATVIASAATSSPSPNTVVDVRGPCDEAEHANDPACAGPQQPQDEDADEAGEAGEDISGPCDEAEHANDPACVAPQGPADPVAGRNDVDDGDDAEREDRSGPSENSGPGSEDSGTGSENSGPGSGGDDSNSGPGSNH